MENVKQKGNDALKQNNYDEAVFHYSHAIKMDPDNFSLYSNRSFAFLKMQQFYFAMEDAKTAIRINPYWPKVRFAQTIY